MASQTRATSSGIERESVESTINYVARIDEPLYTYHNVSPPDGMPASNEARESHRVTISSMRTSHTPSLDIEGFELISLTTKVSDIYDPVERDTIYNSEVAAAVHRRTGAAEVRVFQPFLRGDEAQRRIPGSITAPAGFAHVDYTRKTGPEWFEMFLGEDADKWRGHRYAVINVWRPITGPLQDFPLALCDARTVSPDDLLPSKTIAAVGEDGLYTEGGRVDETEIYSVAHNPAHRWCYAPDMMPNEAILLKNYDSDDSGVARFTPHTAFEDPTASADRLPRASIEIRALTIW